MTTGDEPAGHGDDPVRDFLAWIDADEMPRSPLRPCTYLPGRTARDRAFVAARLDPEVYHELMDRGFRRSGELFYAMDCPGCRACVPLRVPVATFAPSRSQRRVLRRNRDVRLTVRRPVFEQETWDLYRRYLHHQHPATAVDETAEQFRASLYGRVVDSWELRYHVGDRLVGVSLVDASSRSVSAVYHFFAPEDADRSLGVHSVLTEIEWTRQQNVPHYYLGYWVAGSATMHYKANYRPHELWRDGAWQPSGPTPGDAVDRHRA